MHPHLHVLLPSATQGISLEARVYLPRAAADGKIASIISMEGSSDPSPLSMLSAARAEIEQLKITKVVTAAHPWGRLGGNMMFPMIAQILPAAVYDTADGATTAIATFNVRGIGASGGSMPIPGMGIGNDGEDFAAVESTVAELVGGTPDLYRFGYSYGTNLALNAPLPASGVKRTMLVSPAPTMFKALTIFSGPTFAQGLEAALDRAEGATPAGDARSFWLLYGDNDDFTGVETLRALGGTRKEEITTVEVPGCGHFYAQREDAAAAQEAIVAWISGQ